MNHSTFRFSIIHLSRNESHFGDAWEVRDSLDGAGGLPRSHLHNEGVPTLNSLHSFLLKGSRVCSLGVAGHLLGHLGFCGGNNVGSCLLNRSNMVVKEVCWLCVSNRLWDHGLRSLDDLLSPWLDSLRSDLLNRLLRDHLLGILHLWLGHRLLSLHDWLSGLHNWLGHSRSSIGAHCQRIKRRGLILNCHLEAFLHGGVDLAICDLVAKALHVLHGCCSVWVEDGCDTVESSDHATESILVLHTEVDSAPCHIAVLGYLLSNLLVWNSCCSTKGSVCNTVAVVSVNEVVCRLREWVSHVGDLSCGLNSIVFQNLARTCKALADHLSVVLIDS